MSNKVKVKTIQISVCSFNFCKAVLMLNIKFYAEPLQHPNNVINLRSTTLKYFLGSGTGAAVDSITGVAFHKNVEEEDHHIGDGTNMA